MAIQTVRDVLVADQNIYSVVGENISPMTQSQGTVKPSITLQRVSEVPFNGLGGFCGLDANRVQLDVWDDGYEDARSLADACRTALQTAGFIMNLEFDSYEPDVDPKLYRITQDWSVYI